jgi:hypothetical protein
VRGRSHLDGLIGATCLESHVGTHRLTTGQVHLIDGSRLESLCSDSHLVSAGFQCRDFVIAFGVTGDFTGEVGRDVGDLDLRVRDDSAAIVSDRAANCAKACSLREVNPVAQRRHRNTWCAFFMADSFCWGELR